MRPALKFSSLAPTDFGAQNALPLALRHQFSTFGHSKGMRQTIQHYEQHKPQVTNVRAVFLLRRRPFWCPKVAKLIAHGKEVAPAPPKMALRKPVSTGPAKQAPP